MRKFSRGVIFVVVAALGAASAGARGQDTPKQEEEALRKVAADFAQAWNNHDAQAMAMCWAEDGDYIGPDGQQIRGRASLEAFFADTHSWGTFGTSKLAVTGKDVRLLAPTVAVLNAEIEITGQRDFFDKPVPPQKAISTWVLVKKDGKWWAAVYRAFIPPPPPPPE